MTTKRWIHLHGGGPFVFPGDPGFDRGHERDCTEYRRRERKRGLPSEGLASVPASFIVRYCNGECWRVGRRLRDGRYAWTELRTKRDDYDEVVMGEIADALDEIAEAHPDVEPIT